jgi:hypothetical protein
MLPQKGRLIPLIVLRQDRAAARWGLSGKGLRMLRVDRRLIGVAAAAALTSAIGACSSDVTMSDLDPSRKLATLTRPTWLTASSHQEDLTLPPVTEADLIGREGQCAAVPGPAATAEPSLAASRGVALQMTECEVVGRAGAPDNIEVGVNERGERAVALTFTRGLRPGIYRFAAGRLYSIERGLEPSAAPAKQQKQPAKKSRV